MQGSLFTLWLLVYVAIWLLRIQPNSVISRAAFTWIGPKPRAGESWATYQTRWAVYSFGWLCQIALVFSALWFYASRNPGVAVRPWFLALGFSFPIGAGISLLATVTFLIKALKAHYYGPNPTWTPSPHE